MAAATAGSHVIALSISLAALIFTGPLQAGSGPAANAFVLGTGLVSLAVAFFGKMAAPVASTQDTGAVTFAAVSMSLAANADEPVSTTMAALAVTVLLTGITFWMIGYFRLSSIARYLPSPVVTGFVAGTGWLLTVGGLDVMAGFDVGLGDLADLDRARTGLGIAFGLIVVGVLAGLAQRWFLGIAVFVGATGFHIVAAAIGNSDRLYPDGWLIGPFPELTGARALTLNHLTDADWGAIAGQAVSMMAVVAVATLGLLLNLNGLEPILGQDIDLDAELKASGLANLGIAAVGGLTGYHMLGSTTLVHRAGGRSRVVPIVVALMSFGVVLVGADLIALLPRPIAGGLLGGVGVSMLIDWVRQVLPRLRTGDRLISAVIVACMALLGVLAGVAVGIGLAISLFLTNYSRLDPVRRVIDLTGRSAVERGREARELLGQTPGLVQVIQLTGYLFFGSTGRLRQLVRNELNLGDETRCLVVDFSRVVGIDSTAATHLASLVERVSAIDVELVATGLNPALAEVLERHGVSFPKVFEDVDLATSDFEDRWLESAGFDEQHADWDEIPFEFARRIEVAAGTEIITAGTAADVLFLVESGRFDVRRNDRERRVRQVRPGAVLGEVGFFTGAPRSADVIADTDAVVRAITREDFDRFAATAPDDASRIRDILLEHLAFRVATSAEIARDI